MIEVFVKDGDVVEKDAPLLTLESDKSTMEVPAPEAGTVSGLKIKVGDKVSKGDAVCILETHGGATEAPAESKAAPAKAAAETPAPAAARRLEGRRMRALLRGVVRGLATLGREA